MKLSKGQMQALQYMANNRNEWYSLEPVYCWPDELTPQSLRALQRRELIEKGDDYPENIRGIWRITQKGEKIIDDLKQALEGSEK